MNGWEVYLITRLDTVQVSCTVVAIFAGIGMGLASLFWGLETAMPTFGDGPAAGLGRAVRRCGLVVAVATLGAVLTPTSKQMAAIIVLPEIANSETVQIEAREIYDLAKEWLRSSAVGCVSPPK